MEKFQDEAVPNLEYNLFQVNWCVLKLIRLKHVTSEIFCRNRHIHLGLSIFGHILKDFMEIFQDGAFPNLEYHLFQVIWCFSALIT